METEREKLSFGIFSVLPPKLLECQSSRFRKSVVELNHQLITEWACLAQALSNHKGTLCEQQKRLKTENYYKDTITTETNQPEKIQNDQIKTEMIKKISKITTDTN